MKTDKSLGQHWLKDEQVVQQLIEFIEPREGERLVEIGPGTGVLTQRLIEQGAFVIAFDVDPRVIVYMKTRSELSDSLELVQQSILDAVLAEHGATHVVGNIPYNITKPILMKLVDEVAQVERAELLMQKEVAERLYGDKSSVLGLAVQSYFDVTAGPVVAKDAFDPPPRVTSQAVRLTRKDLAELPSKELFEQRMRWVKIGFAQKRKMLKKNLASVPDLDLSIVETVLDELKITRTVRAEELDLATWQKLVVSLEHINRD